MTINASDLNRLVTLKSYDYTTGAAGGASPVIGEEIDNIWASVKQLGGGDRINQGQDKNFADYMVIIRYRPQVTENWLIFYENVVMKIKQMQVDNTAYKRYLIIYASTDIQQNAWS